MAPFGKSSKVRSSTEMNTWLKIPIVINPHGKCPDVLTKTLTEGVLGDCLLKQNS